MKKVILLVLAVLLLVGCSVNNESLVSLDSGNNGSNQQEKIKVKDANQRKTESIKTLELEGISYHETLPVIENASEISLRSKEEILRRALCSYLVSNVAMDYNDDKNNYESSRDFFKDYMHKFGLEDSLLTDNEDIMMSGYAEDMLAIDVEWTVEASKVLFWMLGFLDALDYPSEDNMAETKDLNSIIVKYDSFDEMLLDAKMVDVEEILDLTDLYYRYDWACASKDLLDDESILIGDLDPDIVFERRRAFEWAINSSSNWDNFDYLF